MCVCLGQSFLNELCNLPDMTAAAAADVAAAVADVVVAVAPSASSGAAAPSVANALNPTSMPTPDAAPPAAAAVAPTVACCAADVAAPEISLICCVGVAEDSRAASGAMGRLPSTAAAVMGVGVAVTLVVSKTSFCCCSSCSQLSSSSAAAACNVAGEPLPVPGAGESNVDMASSAEPAVAPLSGVLLNCLCRVRPESGGGGKILYDGT